MHGLDIGIGEEAQHAQRFGRLHLGREGADGIRIEDVASQRSGHLEMGADQPQNEIALVAVKFQPREYILRHANTLLRVVAGAPALTGIVQQRDQIEQARLLQVAEQLPEPRGPFGHGMGDLFSDARLRRTLWQRRLRFKIVQRIDQHERVLIDRVAVVRVADDESVDAMKLRNEQLENAECVHRA